MAKDLKTYLKDEMGLTDEQLGVVLPVLEPKADVFHRTFRTQEEIADVQRQLDEGNARLTAEMAEWAQTRNADDETRKASMKRVERAESQLAVLRTRAQALAESHGADPKELFEGLDDAPNPNPNPNPNPQPPAFDSRYLGVEQAGAVFDTLLTLPAELQAIEREHFDLTGQHLDTRPLIVKYKGLLSQKKAADVREIWEKDHDIATKRQQKATEAHDREIREAEERGFMRARSEEVLPSSYSTTGRSAVVFRTGEHREGGSGSKLQRPQPGDTVRRAAQALATHKYRKQETVTH